MHVRHFGSSFQRPAPRFFLLANYDNLCVIMRSFPFALVLVCGATRLEEIENDTSGEAGPMTCCLMDPVLDAQRQSAQGCSVCSSSLVQEKKGQEGGKGGKLAAKCNLKGLVCQAEQTAKEMPLFRGNLPELRAQKAAGLWRTLRMGKVFPSPAFG